jgi:hypothetical protein
LELGKTNTKSGLPFKYNSSWSSIDDFKNLVHSTWLPLSMARNLSDNDQLFENLQNLKKEASAWAKAHRHVLGKDLISIEQNLEALYAQALGNMSVDAEIRDQCKQLEDKCHSLLIEKE